MKIKFLQAYNGDCILITFDEGTVKRNILIDGGVPATYLKNNRAGDLKKTIDQLDGKIDLLIMTHVDDDHIGGILKWLEKDPNGGDKILEVWFNSGKRISKYLEQEDVEERELVLKRYHDPNVSITQGIKFEEHLNSKSSIRWTEEIIIAPREIKRFGLTFKILSPNRLKLEALLKKWEKEDVKLNVSAPVDDYDLTLREHMLKDEFEEDSATHNGSSIAFILSFNEKNVLFLADAHPSVVLDSLLALGYSIDKPIDAELVKISHHGSKSNNCKELFQMLASKKFIISTNGAKHKHPHKQLLARLISVHSDCELYFNYPQLIDDIFSTDDYREFTNFKAIPLKTEFQL